MSIQRKLTRAARKPLKARLVESKELSPEYDVALYKEQARVGGPVACWVVLVRFQTREATLRLITETDARAEYGRMDLARCAVALGQP